MWKLLWNEEHLSPILWWKPRDGFQLVVSLLSFRLEAETCLQLKSLFLSETEKKVTKR